MTIADSPRRRTRPRFVLAATACAAALAASAVLTPTLATSAHADATSSTGSDHQRHDRAGHRVVHHDARRDVLLVDVESEKQTPYPRDRATDIVATVVDHRVHRLVVQTRVRQLSRSGYRLQISEILTSDGSRYEVDVDYSVRPIDARVTVRRFSSGTEVSCPGATWSMDRTSNRVAASVPNSCLGDPDWVRVGVAVVGAPRDLKTSWADDSRSQGRIGDRHLELGPRQPRA